MRGDVVLGALGGLAAGYVLWLAAFSIVDDNAAVGQWAPTVLLLSLALAVCATTWASLLRRRRKYAWSGFGFALSLPPLLLTLAVFANVYL